MNILERFIKYISIPTNSASKSEEIPSTPTQRNLAKVLVSELKSLNLDEVYYDEKHCYIYAMLKGNSEAQKIGFIAHMDTSEEVTDENVNPQIIKNYDGNSVQLNQTEILDIKDFPKLKNKKGKTLITTDGNTLLGADDKAGIAEIMTMLEYLSRNKISHGDIYIAFTPDEEIGNGTEYFDLSKFKADFAYTVDGSDLGEIAYENFNASTVKIEIKGVSTHWGSGKDVMVNSQLIANEIINMLPNELPQNTEGYEGFYHLEFIQGSVTNTKIQYRIRDFDKENFEARKQKFIDIIDKLNIKYKNCIKLEITDSYHNMKDIISKHMHLIENVKLAMNNIGVTPLINPIRGGTDGAELTFKGLPCPNLGTGGQNFHSIYEYICLEDMEKVVDLLVEIVKIYAT